MILIVEDNVENAELLRLYLERRANLKSVVCVRGDEVVARCRTGEVKLVIMDIQLNNTFLDGRAVGGIELTRRLKDDPKTAAIPVLLSTAHAMREQREQFLRDSGADGYVTKPIENYDTFIGDVQRRLS